jgi:hypothetical protein
VIGPRKLPQKRLAGGTGEGECEPSEWVVNDSRRAGPARCR